MHFDLAHALVTGVLVFVVMTAMHKAGLYRPHSEGGPRWSCPLFVGVGAAVFILNLVWP